MITISKIKKINPEWHPVEMKEIKDDNGRVIDRQPFEVGDIVEITDFRLLVRTGAAVLVDEQGNEIGMPGEKYRCAVCTKEVSELPAFIAHVKNHDRTPSPSVTPQVAASVAATLGQSLEPVAPAPVEQVTVAQVSAEPTLTAEEEKRQKMLAALAKGREIQAAKRVAEKEKLGGI